MSSVNGQKILVVDDEPDLLTAVQKILQKEGLSIITADNAKNALKLMEKHKISIVISDMVMPDMDGVALLRTVKKNYPDIEFILLTAFGSVEKAVEAMRYGAYDFIAKPFKRVTLLKVIQKALEKQNLEKENRFLREQLEGQQKHRFLVGSSKALMDVMSWVTRVAQINSTVLITGESGTGKELVARAIHQNSLRKKKRFVALNCGAIPESLIESELFGHVRGAFTGAIRDKEGFFATASEGTLFLDEIGNIPVSLQIKLLRAIEEKEIQPVGLTIPVPINVRIIAASNRDLMAEVEAGNFREDLYYRINVVGISIPPLRERREDIPDLIRHFIQKHNVELNKNIRAADEKTIDILCALEWKGNVRELDNVIERAMILCDEGILLPEHLPDCIKGITQDNSNLVDMKHAVQRFECEYISRVLTRLSYDKNVTAQVLGLSQSSLYRKMADLGIPLSAPDSQK